jgi:hypothetical protein
MVDLEIDDTDYITEIVAEIEVDSLRLARRAVYVAGQHMRKAVVEKLAGQRTGKEYPVPGTSQRKYNIRPDGSRRKRKLRTYRASAKGEPPAVATGWLRKHIAVSRVQRVGDEVFVDVGVDLEVVPYARRLEYGGAHTAKGGKVIQIDKRPYLRPTFTEQEATVVEMMRAEIEK